MLLLWVWTKSYVAKWPTNDVQGDAGYQDVIESANMLAEVCYLQSLNTSFPSLWLCRFNFFLLIRLRIFIAAATSNETRRSVDWIHWCHRSKNKQGMDDWFHSRSRCFLSLLWCSSLCAMNPAASKMNEFILDRSKTDSVVVFGFVFVFFQNAISSPNQQSLRPPQHVMWT